MNLHSVSDTVLSRGGEMMNLLIYKLCSQGTQNLMIERHKIENDNMLFIAVVKMLTKINYQEGKKKGILSVPN